MTTNPACTDTVITRLALRKISGNRPLFALIAGALNVFAFAPFGLWPLQIITLAFMFALALRSTGWKQAALVGWSYALGWYAAGIHWLYVSMHNYGGLPGWMAAAAVGLLSLYLGIFCSLAMGGTVWLRQRFKIGPAASLLLLFPAAFALAEWLRGWVLTGFPWVGAGYAHVTGPLAGFAPLIGVYGIGLIAAAAAGALALTPSKKPAALLAIALCAVGYAFQFTDWTKPHGQPISVRLLQGNVPQNLKFDPEVIGSTLMLYHDMVTQAPADLIATPETAIPLLSAQLPPDYLPRFASYVEKSHSHVVLGIPISDGPQQYANSAIGIAPSGAAKPYRYDKHHLVPFGEFIPAGARWFVDMMHIPLGDFSRGDLLQAPFAVRDQQVLPNICYEDLFGEEIAAQLASGKKQATILLNMSNIAWFGDSIALPQHLQISQMRSLETGRPMLRATNTGMTAVIDAHGRVAAMLDPFTRSVLAATVQGYEGLTPYSRFGNLPVVLLSLAALIGVIWHARTSGNNRA
jgi:apolipoprotein N-acyltransferase